VILHHLQKIIRAESLDEAIWSLYQAHLPVTIDQDRRRCQCVPAVVPLPRRRQQLCHLRQVFVLIGHDCEMRELRLRLATAVKVVERNSHNADVTRIEVLVTRFELT
jgi:hypothetical protein